MLLITNISRNNIVISDLGITIKPKQAIDIHKINYSYTIEGSKDLKNAINKGAIKILCQNNSIKKEKQKEEVVNNKKDFDDLKDFMKKEIKEQLSKVGGNVDNQLLVETLNKLSNLISQKDEKKVEEEDNTDSEKIINIHAKKVEKMSKNVQSSIDYTKNQVQDKSILDNASELEKML